MTPEEYDPMQDCSVLSIVSISITVINAGLMWFLLSNSGDHFSIRLLGIIIIMGIFSVVMAVKAVCLPTYNYLGAMALIMAGLPLLVIMMGSCDMISHPFCIGGGR